ncbi:MAG: hypothetical protein R2719_12630 [Micropruina sp.]
MVLRRDALPLIEVLHQRRTAAGGEPEPIGFDEPLYSAGAVSSDDPATDRIRLVHGRWSALARLEEVPAGHR